MQIAKRTVQFGYYTSGSSTDNDTGIARDKEALMIDRGGQIAVKSPGSRHFKFEDAEVFAELLQRDVPAAQEMYFRETLYRCFLASQISLMRSD